LDDIRKQVSLCSSKAILQKPSLESSGSEKPPKTFTLFCSKKPGRCRDLNAHGVLLPVKVCLNTCPWSSTSVAYSKELCIWTSTTTCPSRLELLIEPNSFVSTKVDVFLCLDVGKDSDDRDVDENVRTPTTVSARRDQPFQTETRKLLPLPRSLETGEEKI
jgi:hypothetical protein